MGEVESDLQATDERICPHCQSAFYQVGGLNQRVLEDTAQRVVRRIACWSCKQEFLFVTYPPPPY